MGESDCGQFLISDIRKSEVVMSISVWLGVLKLVKVLFVGFIVVPGSIWFASRDRKQTR